MRVTQARNFLQGAHDVGMCVQTLGTAQIMEKVREIPGSEESETAIQPTQALTSRFVKAKSKVGYIQIPLLWQFVSLEKQFLPWCLIVYLNSLSQQQ